MRSDRPAILYAHQDSKTVLFDKGKDLCPVFFFVSSGYIHVFVLPRPPHATTSELRQSFVPRSELRQGIVPCPSSFVPFTPLVNVRNLQFFRLPWPRPYLHSASQCSGLHYRRNPGKPFWRWGLRSS